MLIQLIVITGFEEHFQQMNAIRRKQCAHYRIPVLFCYNGPIPEGYVFREDEIYINVARSNNETNTAELVEGMNPSMFVKFQMAIQDLQKNHSTPVFYIRCTASCFIDFSQLYMILRCLPKNQCIAGPYDSKYDDRIFCNGTCMILSADVARRLANESIDDPMAWIENDDVTISWIGMNYAALLDTTYWFSYYENLEELPDKLREEPRRKVLYRIKNPKDRLTIDVGLWKMLSKAIDRFEESEHM